MIDRKTLKVGDVVFFEGTHMKPTVVLFTDEAVTLFRTDKDVDFMSRRTSEHEYTAFPTDLTDRNGRVVNVGDTLRWGGVNATITGEFTKVLNIWCARVQGKSYAQHDLWPLYTISNHCALVEPRLSLSEFISANGYGIFAKRRLVEKAVRIERERGIDLDS